MVLIAFLPPTIESLILLPIRAQDSATNQQRIEPPAYSSLGIQIDGKTWAVQYPHELRGCLKALPHEVWQYLELAMGREIDGIRFGDTSAPLA